MYKVVFQIYGKSDIPDNWIVDYTSPSHRLYYINKNSAVYKTNSGIHHFEEGCLYIFPSLSKVEFIADSDCKLNHTFFDFIISPILSLDHVLKIDLKDESFQMIKKAMDMLNDTMDKYEIRSAVSAHIDLITTLFEVLIYFINEKYPIFSGRMDQRILDSLNYIHRHYNEAISVEKLASLSYLDTNYFNRLFRKSMNVSVHRYIKAYRLQIAFSMLKNGEKVTDVAQAAGYQSVSSFSNAVKKEFGFYPSELKLIKP